MTNYNDGNWHGWNGGECPVHPESVVEVQYCDKEKSEAKAFVWRYGGGDYDIIAFRVVKEYIDPPKPREFYAHEMETHLLSPNKPLEHLGTEWRHCDKETTGAILFREVI